jgi:hypothetical protein
MVASRDQAIWNNMKNVWNLPLEHPIEVKPNGELTTLGDVGALILGLPDAVKREQRWLAAAEALVEATKSHNTGPVTVAVHMALILSGHNAVSTVIDLNDVIASARARVRHVMTIARHEHQRPDDGRSALDSDRDVAIS